MMTTLNLDEMPPELFDHIMFLLGYDSLESLESCRKVNSTWDKRIMNSLWENPSKKWGPIIGRQFERSWDINLPSEEKISKALKLEADGIVPAAVMDSLEEKLRQKFGAPSLQEIRCAASLALKGRLNSADYLCLEGDLSSVPAQNLAPLVSCVTGSVQIHNISGCDLLSILNSIRSRELIITRQSLNCDETQALVRILDSWVETVFLMTDVDIAALTQYSGQGKCWYVSCDNRSSMAQYQGQEDQLRSWAGIKDWDVICNGEVFALMRNQFF